MKKEKRIVTSIEQIPIIIDVKFFADFLQVSVPTAYRIIEKENVPFFCTASKKLIRKKDLLEWLEKRFVRIA